MRWGRGGELYSEVPESSVPSLGADEMGQGEDEEGSFRSTVSAEMQWRLCVNCEVYTHRDGLTCIQGDGLSWLSI